MPSNSQCAQGSSLDCLLPVPSLTGPKVAQGTDLQTEFWNQVAHCSRAKLTLGEKWDLVTQIL